MCDGIVTNGLGERLRLKVQGLGLPFDFCVGVMAVESPRCPRRYGKYYFAQYERRLRTGGDLVYIRGDSLEAAF